MPWSFATILYAPPLRRKRSFASHASQTQSSFVRSFFVLRKVVTLTTWAELRSKSSSCFESTGSRYPACFYPLRYSVCTTFEECLLSTLLSSKCRLELISTNSCLFCLSTYSGNSFVDTQFLEGWSQSTACLNVTQLPAPQEKNL